MVNVVGQANAVGLTSIEGSFFLVVSAETAGYLGHSRSLAVGDVNTQKVYHVIYADQGRGDISVWPCFSRTASPEGLV